MNYRTDMDHLIIIVCIGKNKFFLYSFLISIRK